jgi:ligand-binding sensor domain-containing protein
MGPLGIKALVMTDEDTLYAGTSQGLYRRSSDENSWKRVDLPPSNSHPSSKSSKPEAIQSIVISQGSGLYAATEDQLFRQGGKDKTWESMLMESTPGKIRGLAVNETVYAWTETAILWGERSRDGLFHWKNISESLPQDLIIYTVLVEKDKRGSVMYAGTDRGLFWTRDKGKHWQSAQGSHAGHPVETIYTPAKGVLLLGSQEQGVLIAINLSQKGILGRFWGQ